MRRKQQYPVVMEQKIEWLMVREKGECSHHDNTSRLTSSSTVSVTEALNCIRANHSTIRVNDHDDILASIGECCQLVA